MSSVLCFICFRSLAVDQRLANKVALVTGASSGIGAAIARSLARAGAKVAMAARRVDMLDANRRLIEEQGGVAIAVKCDVTDRQMVADAVKHVRMTLGEIDILVNNAGVMYYTMMKNLQLDEWERQIDINCKVSAQVKASIIYSEWQLRLSLSHCILLSPFLRHECVHLWYCVIVPDGCLEVLAVRKYAQHSVLESRAL